MKSPTNKPTLPPDTHHKFLSTSYLLENYPKKQSVSQSKQLLLNLESIALSRSKRQMLRRREDKLLESLQKQFDGSDLRETFRSTGIPRYQPKYSQDSNTNKIKHQKSQIAKQEQKQQTTIILTDNPQQTNSANTLWKQFLSQKTHPNITNKIQKQKVSLERQILFQIYRKAYREIVTLHEDQKQLFYTIYHQKDDEKKNQKQTMELIRQKYKKQEEQIQNIEEELQRKYDQLRNLLNGILKNGYYQVDGVETIVMLMAYTDKYIRRYKEECEGIIQGTLKMSGKQSMKKQVLMKERGRREGSQILRDYEIYEAVSMKPKKEDFPEILDKKSHKYILKLYEYYLQNGQYIDSLLQINKSTLLSYVKHSIPKRKNAQFKIPKPRIQSRLEMIDSTQENQLKQSIQPFPVPEQPQKQQINSNPNTISSYINSQIYNPENTTMGLSDLQESTIKPRYNRSLLDTKLRTKNDVQEVYKKIKGVTLPDIFNISRVHDHDHDRYASDKNSVQKNSIVNADKQSIQRKQLVNFTANLKVPLKYSYFSNNSQIESIGRQYRKRISLPIINSQIKITKKKNSQNSNQKSLNSSMTSNSLKKTSKKQIHSINNTLSHKMPIQTSIEYLIQTKLSQKRRIKNAYSKYVYPEVYKLLFGLLEEQH